MDQGLRLRISLCFWIPMSTTYCQKHWTQDQIWSTSLWQLLQNSCQRFSVDKQQEELVNCNSRADFDLNLSKLKVTWNELELEERRKKKMSEDAKFFLYFEKTRLKCCPSLMTKSSPRSWHRGRHVWQQLPWVKECVPENLDGKQKERCLTGCQWYSRICDETTSRYWQSVYRNVRSIRLKGRVQQCKNASKLLGSKSLQNEGSFLTMSQLFQWNLLTMMKFQPIPLQGNFRG